MQAGMLDPNQVLEFIRRRVAEGYDSEEAIASSATELFAEQAGPAASEAVYEALAQALAEHRSAQQGWLGPTDCDRLDRAFAALEEGGVVARQNFTCCQSCGHDEIWGELEQARQQGRAVRGYCFFHTQDTERALESGELLLAYGAVEKGDAASAEVAELARLALESAGLEVAWDGSVRTRLRIKLDWRRRRALDA